MATRQARFFLLQIDLFDLNLKRSSA